MEDLMPRIDFNDEADELVDQIGPELAQELIQATMMCHPELTAPVWAKRRYDFNHYLNVIEMNLDYDLRSRGIAA